MYVHIILLYDIRKQTDRLPRHIILYSIIYNACYIKYFFEGRIFSYIYTFVFHFQRPEPVLEKNIKILLSAVYTGIMRYCIVLLYIGILAKDLAASLRNFKFSYIVYNIIFIKLLRKLWRFNIVYHILLLIIIIRYIFNERCTRLNLPQRF